MKDSEQASFWRPALASLAVYTVNMSIGAGAGFCGVAIPQLKQSPEDGGFGFSEEQISWLASLQIFSTIFTCLLGGFLGEYLGRRMVCCLSSPVFLASFLCVALAPTSHLLFFGQILGGIALGLVSSSTGVYISEVATPAWRMTLSSGLSSFYMVGMVAAFTLGKWVSWRWLAGLSCTFPLLSLTLLCLVPESPSWLVTQGRITEARKALQWIRGDHFDVTEELTKLKASFRKTQMQAAVQGTGGWLHFRRTQDFIGKLRRPDVFKPLLVVTTLMLLQQFTGIATTSYYAIVLMGDGRWLDKYSATIIYGFIRLLSTFMGGLLLRRFPRRPLLICSSLCVALGMALLGASAYISEGREDVPPIVELLPLIAVNTVAVSYQLGLGPIGWAYIAELYPVDMRAALGGFSFMSINIFVFLVIKTFPTLKESALQPWGTYWLYACVAVGKAVTIHLIVAAYLQVLAAVFGATVLPETKGKTLAEISDYFYVCCAFQQKEGHVESCDIEYRAFAEDPAKDDTTSDSLVYRYHDKAREILTDTKTAREERIQMRFKRRSMELGDVEGSLKRRTLELSMLEEVIQQKVEELVEQEQKLRRKSAPIVMHEELDQLL